MSNSIPKKQTIFVADLAHLMVAPFLPNDYSGVRNVWIGYQKSRDLSGIISFQFKHRMDKAEMRATAPWRFPCTMFHVTLSSSGADPFYELIVRPHGADPGGISLHQTLHLHAVASLLSGDPGDFESLVGTHKHVDSLYVNSFDKAKFHGGKDGHPFPAPVAVYDETLRVLRSGIDKANLGNEERLAAIRCLDDEARRMERVVERGEGFATLIARERRQGRQFVGRTVFDDKPTRKSKKG
jgi:hypothetical protein